MPRSRPDSAPQRSLSPRNDAVNLLLVGCGIMGARHLRGYAELERARPGTLRLRAVCDLREEAAERVATEAEARLG